SDGTGRTATATVRLRVGSPYGASDCTKTSIGADWTTAANWTPAGVPGSAAVACITSGATVNLDGSVQRVEGLVVTGAGTLQLGAASASSLDLAGAHGSSRIANLVLNPGSTLSGAAETKVTSSLSLPAVGPRQA